MLSRVADSLYWMSRYFERATNCAQVLEATWSFMMAPSKITPGGRWHRALVSVGLAADDAEGDPQGAMMRLAWDRSGRCSIFSCIGAARENASQVREKISSEMWEQLNRLYHSVSNAAQHAGASDAIIDLVTEIRQASYQFQGVTDATMNHGEGFHFIQLGKFTERACAMSLLLDAYLSIEAPVSDLDWMNLLTSCSAFEAYCKVYTAELHPARIAEFILLHPEFPYSVRYSADQMDLALAAIALRCAPRRAGPIERMMGRLRSSMTYAHIDEVMADNVHIFLLGVVDQCRRLHAALQQVYIDYPVEAAFEA
jgi:uncharacterized alpha-E superfamily protein